MNAVNNLAGFRELYSIGQQILQNLAHAKGIAPHDGRHLTCERGLER